MLDLAVIGGGAAGFFTAINAKQQDPALKILIFEKGLTVLNKVRISGGGRCNVTHACFDPNRLIQFYPRGSKELLSVFKQFGPSDTIQWFEKRGLSIKQEADGRMFPVTDNSESIINCFMDACADLDIEIRTRSAVNSIKKTTCFELQVNGEWIQSKKILVAAGSSPFFWNLLQDLGHTIVQPVPSLFTFNIKHPLLEDLKGLSMAQAKVTLQVDKQVLQKFKIKESELTQAGPLLITHWGLSGPAILKLSSIAARVLNHLNYRFKINLNLSGLNVEETFAYLLEQKDKFRKKQVINSPLFSIPQRWWQRIHSLTFSNVQINWSDVSKKELQTLANALSQYELNVDGKSTFKDEFVTAGGVDLKEIDFKTMESKLVSGMYLAGEIINVDALTGGFNFQAAWSEAWVISKNI